MLIEDDPFRCFMPYEPVPVASAEGGPLADLTLAVKDIFDVAGYRTGSGCPTRLAQSPVHSHTAPAAQKLLDAGARFVGKTHTDELAWSMYGMNAHFGTPVNPAAPDRIPGGSSSGSAVAVAAGLADIAIGSDTGGSVRAPASFCGIWGIRPTHGRISLQHVQPLAESYDTCGVFARDSETLLRAMSVMLDGETAALPESPDFLRPVDMLDQLQPEALGVWEARFGALPARDVSVYPEGVEAAYTAFLRTMGADARKWVVPFIRHSGMPLVRGIDGRAEAAEALTEAEIAGAEATRRAFTAHLEALLGPGGVILAPVVPEPPFRLDAPVEVFDAYRHGAMRLLCVAGLSGLPQVVMPAGSVDGAPYGLSLIGPRGSDLSLLALACRLMAESPGPRNPAPVTA
ncbi:amidase [Salipiger sp. PrR002]|uniref:amidase n=1 Tax=Salipiger sp. PrR002 TaxID=2706489 RepID=UPI0013BDE407|nr:amidase [Salipiger sp. PrR002]NDV97755.1 amidase [Salipiger sp. PrR002]NDW55246.1 amidase [Salipiger sp. PrR004]